VVSLEVGPDEKTVCVHKSFLIEASTFFKSAITGNFKEAADNEIKRPEESEEVFEPFLRWVYSRRDYLVETLWRRTQRTF